MKRIFTLLVVGVFAFSLVACDNQATTGAVSDTVGDVVGAVGDAAPNLMRPIFLNGKLLIDERLTEVRSRCLSFI